MASSSNLALTSGMDSLSLNGDGKEGLIIKEEGLENVQAGNDLFLIPTKETMADGVSQEQYQGDGSFRSKEYYQPNSGGYCLWDDEGNRRDWGLGLEELMLDNFNSLFSSSGCDGAPIFDCVPQVVSEEQNLALTANFSREEIKQAINSMHPDKSPGPDGMNPAFHQCFWNIVVSVAISPSVVQWMRPPVGMLKCNVDAAVFGGVGKIGTSWVVRDHEGKVLNERQVSHDGVRMQQLQKQYLTGGPQLEEVEKLRELEVSGEMRTINNSIKAVVAKVTEIESLVEAFEGCRGVFHTAAFTDPAGLSGYTKSMAEIEVKATENVIMACSRTRTSSVRNCVLTSSLLAFVWRDATTQDLSPVIDQESWSDESLCMDKKLWYALGKLRAEKAAWRIAKEKGLKLVTICPGLITGPNFFHRNPSATIAYLKGAQEMFADGLLATADVMKLAEAHAFLL
ncbi:hypothetical protein GH714_010323 [Hevea brasiliensis]|uniref:3-beta hydroxysteroid dehydrogenase/isomerase domain-containing protein n=1 Tax=Hevea brasiliensis TaxID=3981 RepID=A0A6A6M7X9_HEVBR|nr:hypothetical protein GH714_010323 [Hevea brasiliensis]